MSQQDRTPLRPWSRPRFEEIGVGLEIGAYAPSELDRPELVRPELDRPARERPSPPRRS